MSQTCPVCNTRLPAGAEFCTECGARLEAPPRSPAWVIFPALAGLCLLAFLLLAGGWYLLNRGKLPLQPGNSPTPLPQPAASPTVTQTPILPTATPSPRRAQISNEIYFAAIRKSPGYSGKNDKVDVLASVPAGEVVEILQPEPQSADGLSWWYISWGGVRGWMADHTGSGKTILVFLP